MKILFVGHHMPHYTHTNVYREKAIQELGHDLVFFDDRDFVFPGRIRDRIRFLQNWDSRRLNNKLVKVARNQETDLCIVMGSRLPLPRRETVSELKRMGCHTALWVTDVPRYSGFSLIRESAASYDYVFCAGTETIDVLKNAGAERVSWLPFGCDPDYHRAVSLNGEEKKRYGRDVVFVGAFYPNRWQILKELGEFEVGIWGPYWDKAANENVDKMYLKDVKIDVSEWVKIYSSAKIVMVVHYQGDNAPCYQASPKVYEALACGCFVLVDRQKDVFALFEDNRHLVGFDSIEDLKAKIRHYLANPDERKEIAERGRREVLSHHTFCHRIEALIKIVCEG